MQDLKKFIKKYLLWFLAFIGLIVFLYVFKKVFTNDITNIDNMVYGFISRFISTPLTTIFKIITEFGNFYIMAFIVILFLIFNKDKSFKKYMIINSLLVVILNQVLKNIVSRPRPIDINLVIEHGFSFPSGHSMVSLAFYGFLAYYIYHCPLKKKYRYTIIGLLAILILFIGISRIYLGVHYFSDVIGAYGISLFYLVLFIKFIYLKEKN